MNIISAVVFVQGNISNIKAENVYTLSGLRYLISSGEEVVFSPEQMENLYNILLKNNDITINDEEHIQNIQRAQLNVAMNICPRCGKQLVERNGKYGAFIGCSGYPECKFIKR